jgi:spore maturation protein CgeB
VELYSRSHISLGFLEVYDRHEAGAPVLKHLHLREFEAPMCGALYCTGYSDELAEFFAPDHDVIVYRDPDELLSKVRYYLTHAEAGERIRRAGHERALRDHTSHERFKSLFRTIGLKREIKVSAMTGRSSPPA